MDKYLLLKQKLEKYNQEHILNFYNELDENQKENLLNQIEKTDFDQLSKLYENRDVVEKEEGIIEPIPYIKKNDLDKEEKEKYLQLGEKAIKDGNVAVVIMAGGQGTRLGHTGPKGTFKLDLDKPTSIFEILVKKLKDIDNKYGIKLPFYIMTSRENNDATEKFFEENNYFNYPKENVKFFMQSELTMLDLSGKAIMEDKGRIKQAADGNGGIFEALFRNNIIDDMIKRNIKYVFIGNIDNVLLQLADPIMIGISVDKNAQLVSKSLIKSSPYEKVGVFYKRDGKPSVIEYTEVTDEMANEKDENGNFVYGQSYIGCNLFNIKALEKIGNDPLKYHTAVKKCNYIDENGNEVISTEPNAYKFEAFIFDAFKRLDDLVVLEVNRDEEFAPVKNMTGNDSPQTAIELYKKYYNI